MSGEFRRYINQRPHSQKGRLFACRSTLFLRFRRSKPFAAAKYLGMTSPQSRHFAMSLRRKILGAAARWAAPSWTRQGVCGLHTSGAASSSAKAPGTCDTAIASARHLRTEDRFRSSFLRLLDRLDSTNPAFGYFLGAELKHGREAYKRRSTRNGASALCTSSLTPPQNTHPQVLPRTRSSTTSTMPWWWAPAAPVYEPRSVCPSTG